MWERKRRGDEIWRQDWAHERGFRAKKEKQKANKNAEEYEANNTHLAKVPNLIQGSNATFYEAAFLVPHRRQQSFNTGGGGGVGGGVVGRIDGD